MQLGRCGVHEADPHSEGEEIAVRQRLAVDEPERVAPAPGFDDVTAQTERRNGFENWIVALAHKARLPRAGEGAKRWDLRGKKPNDPVGGYRVPLRPKALMHQPRRGPLGSASTLAVTRICELSPRNLIARKARLVPWALRALEARASSSR